MSDFLDETRHGGLSEQGHLPVECGSRNGVIKQEICTSRLILIIMSGSDKLEIGEHGLVVEEARPKLKPPAMYRVIILNDDYTPMEFVVEILEMIFGMDRTMATRIMLDVHTSGKGTAGIYTYEIAETRAAQVNSLSRQSQHPLLCTMEED
jgi:ATP-dependent Clp protease adaptor protein ClpS